MRRKEERSKQGQTNNKAKQHSTPKVVMYVPAMYVLYVYMLYVLYVYDASHFPGTRQVPSCLHV